MKLPSLAEVRKAAVAVLGVASMVVASGFLHGRLLLDVEAGVAFVTAVLTYGVPNSAPKAAPPVGPTVADAILAPETTTSPTAPAAAQMGSDPMAAVANSGVAQPPPV